MLDKALLRPGRFDRRITVDRPNLAGRLATLQVHTRSIKLSEDVNLEKIAQATAGCVGADLANLVNEAALRAVRLGRRLVTQDDLLASFETVIAGSEKKNSVLTEFEKKLVAYHEVGHAMVAYKQKNAEPVQKITIVPHTEGSLGYTLLMPEEDKTNLRTKDELMAKITVSMGGRAAEEVVMNTMTNGASQDIQEATSIARNMVAGRRGLCRPAPPAGGQEAGGPGGERCTKYCALGNWDILPFLEEAGCEVAVNGFSWYILYYISSQIAGTTGPVQALWRGLGAWMAGLQRTMTAALAAHGFHSLPPFPAFQREAADWISQTLRVADGWLIGAECAAHIHAGCHRVLAMQPFGCLPNHVCGRGQYAALLRRLGRGKVVSVDLDASLPRLLVYNRVKLLLEGRGMRKTLSEPQGFGEGFVLFVQSILVERYSVCLGIGSEEPLGGLPVGFFHIYQVIPVLLHLV